MSAPRSRARLVDRVLDGLASYLPLLLMAVLALGSWWLVSESPLPQPARAAAPPRHIPDYSMAGFTVQRFGTDGRLRAEIAGDALRHYPDTDTLEIDNPRLRSIAPDGLVTDASARHAVGSDDGDEVELTGDARVTRQAKGGRPPIEFSGEQLHADFVAEKLSSRKPVRLSQGGAVWHAGGFDYDHVTQRIELHGALRAVFPPGSLGGR